MSYSDNEDIKQYLPLCQLTSLTNSGDPTAVTIDDDKLSLAREFAFADVNSSIVSQYDLTVTDAVKPDWLKHAEVIIACVWICRLAANGSIPPGLQALYDERMQALSEIKLGQRQIPGVHVRSDPGVSMSNLTHDQRWQRTKIRTTPILNTGDQNSAVVRNTDYMAGPY